MKLMKRKQPDPAIEGRGGDHGGLVDEALTREVIAAFYKVYNTLGHGFLESVYSRALYIELGRSGFRVKREVTVTEFYEPATLRWVSFFPSGLGQPSIA